MTPALNSPRLRLFRDKLDRIGLSTTESFLFAILLLLFILVVLVRFDHVFTWGVPILAVGFTGVGAMVGFLHSLYGDEEKEAFKSVLTAFATALSGASLADLTNANGLLRHTYHELAAAAGLGGEREGLVLGLASIFMPLGFFTLYFYRRLVLNREQRREDSKENARSALAPANEIDLDASASAAVFRTDPAARELASAWLHREPNGEPGYDDLLADARAQIALADYTAAAASLRRALHLRPDSALASFLLAATYVAVENYTEAVGILDTLTQKNPGQSPLNAWKLLGYARLFHDPAKPDHAQAMRLSLTATTKFLTANPGDLGALLNRACAAGQLGPADADARARLFADLTQLFRLDPDAKDDVRALTADGLDFAAWKNDPAFKLLIT